MLCGYLILQQQENINNKNVTQVITIRDIEIQIKNRKNNDTNIIKNLFIEFFNLVQFPDLIHIYTVYNLYIESLWRSK